MQQCGQLRELTPTLPRKAGIEASLQAAQLIAARLLSSVALPVKLLLTTQRAVKHSPCRQHRQQCRLKDGTTLLSRKREEQLEY